VSSAPYAASIAAVLLVLQGCGGGTTAAAATGGGAVLKVPVASSPVDGPADAWVTIVEFSDFECPYCAAVQPALVSVLQEFGPDVRLVFKNFPLSMHAHARPVAIAAECAHAQGRFWEFHDLVFAGHSALFDAADFEAALAQVAAQAGVDAGPWQACRADPATEAKVIGDMQVGVRWGIGSTPSFVVNGALLVGNQPASAFRTAITRARDLARASGVPADRYYDTVILGP
jgi:protein-disulfide isomerase